MQKSLSGEEFHWILIPIHRVYFSAVKYINVDTSVAIIRCPRDYHRQVWAALTTITSIQQCPCTVQVLHLGGVCVRAYIYFLFKELLSYLFQGTIQSCQKFLIKYNTQKLRGMLRESDSLGMIKCPCRLDLII